MKNPTVNNLIYTMVTVIIMLFVTDLTDNWLIRIPVAFLIAFVSDTLKKIYTKQTAFRS